MAGRKPKPTALKLVQGNPGKRPLNKREPKPKVVIPALPDWLEDPVAREAWGQLAPMLAGLKVLTEADVPALTLMVDTYGIYRQAREALKGGLSYTSTTEDGAEFIRPKPEVVIVADACKRLRALMTDFGMTPSSRSKIQVGGEEEFDPFETFLSGKKKKP